MKNQKFLPYLPCDFETTFFVWKSIDNPTALSPPVELEFTVLEEPESKLEHYDIEIIGLKNQYKIGEKCSFNFVISGYGYSCANYDVKYPDGNGNLMVMGAEVLCATEQHMNTFEINHTERKEML